MATKYEFYTPTADGQRFTHGANWLAMTFTVGNRGTNVDHIATSVKLQLNKGGTPPGTFTVSIRATANGLPTGSDLASGTTNPTTLPAFNDSELREITLGNGVLLREDTKYAIVIRLPSGADPNMVGWRRLSTGGGANYGGGVIHSSTDSGSTWSVLSADHLFEVWGDTEGSGGTGAIWPIDPLLRASGIKRTFWAGIGGQAVYQVELALGGMSTTYVSPIGERQPVSAVTPTPLPTGAGYQPADYQNWLNYFITNNLQGLLKTFGKIPTYEEWLRWRQTGGVI